MKVYLRKRKQGKNGKISLYLEYYKGKSTDADGKIRYIREFEYLNMYLKDKPKTSADRQHNKKILQVAERIKYEKELSLLAGHPLSFSTNTDVKDSNFYEYFYDYCEQKREMPVYVTYQQSVRVFKAFAGTEINFSAIDEKFCSKYLFHLQSKKSRCGGLLKKSSVNQYFQHFSSAVKQAIKEKIIVNNPLLHLKPLKVEDKEIIYLTLEELKLLIKTDCKQSELKRAFLFSCLTGLRWSDVYKLTWGEIEENQGKYSIVYRQQKTQELNYLPLSEQAVRYSFHRIS